MPRGGGHHGGHGGHHGNFHHGGHNGYYNRGYGGYGYGYPGIFPYSYGYPYTLGSYPILANQFQNMSPQQTICTVDTYGNIIGCKTV
jgi:hypothetical protein